MFSTLQRKPEVARSTSLQTRNQPVFSYELSDCESRSARRQHGMAILEVPIYLILFLTLTIGLIDLGVGVWEYNTVAHLARQGTRYAIVNSAASTSADIQNLVKDRAQDLGLTRAGVTVTATWTPDHNPGSVVTLQVQYTYTPVAHLFLRRTVVLHATSKMVVSQ